MLPNASLPRPQLQLKLGQCPFVISLTTQSPGETVVVHSAEVETTLEIAKDDFVISVSSRAMIKSFVGNLLSFYETTTINLVTLKIPGVTNQSST